ncbi:cell division protein FtsA [Weissella diestrammenae]|uniref:Cell division protein FtsA n=1 Tax=Weissella diestrammenae TaxID=1162633 RepID=A0A7G9T634_9LACO|nr:cell division protein FtsA [Weissella diestrammenae]MCM0582395.1 cell division protein FtsA [Weissella diestrammenae]QNN75559.1 cell division protein FtsA [Weissella diestrammenae]
MANHGMIVGLDVGTNTVKVLVADVRDKQVNVIAVGRAVSHGVKRGVVVDIDAAANDIRMALAQVTEQTNQEVKEVIASIPATAIQMRAVNGTVAVHDSQHISYADVAAAVQASISQLTLKDQTVVDLTPQEFIVDNFAGVTDPNDMVGTHLTMRGIAYVGPHQLTDNLRAAIERAGLRLRDMVLAPLAASQTIVSDAEQEFGTIMLDMGAGQTTAAIVHNHQMKFIATFSAGGSNITKDISTVFNISHQDAERLKLDAGLAAPQFANNSNQLTIQPVGQSDMRITESELAEVIGARVHQILTKLGQRIDTVSGFQLPGGLVVSGGSAALRHTQDVLKSTYGVNVKLYMPNEIGLRHPAYVGAWSIVNYAARQTQVALVVKQALYGLPISFMTNGSQNLRQGNHRPQTVKKQNTPQNFEEPARESEPVRNRMSFGQRVNTWFKELFN